MASRRHRLGSTLAALSLLAAAFVTVHVQQVHERSGEYSLSPSAAAPKIQVGGRDYVRSRNDVTVVPPGDEPFGSTEGGGEVFGEFLPGTPATVVYVVVADETFQYGLVGGP